MAVQISGVSAQVILVCFTLLKLQANIIRSGGVKEEEL